jgi:hypothetical protein
MLERPDLEQNGRSIVKQVAYCIGAVGAALAVDLIQLLQKDLFTDLAKVLLFLLILLILALALTAFIRSFGLVRGLQGEIMQRL